MAVRKFLLGLVIICGLGIANPVHAQEHLPFADPLYFDPDFRFFQPIYRMDLEDMKPRKRAPTGFFGAYQRAYIWVTQPEGPEETGGDFGWGHRYDFGYWLENDHGWSATVWNLDGPNAVDAVVFQRLNQFFTNEQDPPISPVDNSLIVPDFDSNDRFTLERTYDLDFHRNILDFGGFELNKTWRMDTMHYGGILEPMVGVRYIGAKDIGLATYYDTTANFGGNIVLPTPEAPDVAYETLTRDIQISNNDLYGGQFGFRYYKYRNRWTFSTDLRVMAMQNFYDVETTRRIDETAYDNPVPINAPARRYGSTKFTTRDRDNVFAFGMDLRTEASYQLTKGFSLRVGLQVFDMFQGIVRTAAIPYTGPGPGIPVPPFSLPAAEEQDVQMAGVTFGATLNL